MGRELKEAGFALPVTVWTDVAKWRGASPEARRTTLECFYSRYRLPLITVLRHLGLNASDAEDALHDFVVAQIEGGILQIADPARGRFRNLLLTSLKRFLASRWRRANADKRRPTGGFEHLDAEAIDGQSLKEFIADSCTPDEVFHRAWLLTLLARVYSRLQEEFESKDQRCQLYVFERRILGPIMRGDQSPAISQLADDLGVTPVEASNHLVTAKRAYRRLLRNEIQTYLGTEKEVTEEIRDFLYFLANLKP